MTCVSQFRVRAGFLRGLVVVVAVTVAGTTVAAAWPTRPAPRPLTGTTRRAPDPLHGITIALDPGHQLGNHRYSREINRPVPAGGFTKPCNTTGTATNCGVARGDGELPPLARR